MVTNAQIENDLTCFVQSQAAGDTPVTTDTDLIESLVLDSLLLMDLVLHVESTYGISLQDVEMSPRHFRTIRSLTQLVWEKTRTQDQGETQLPNALKRRKGSGTFAGNDGQHKRRLFPPANEPDPSL